MQQTKIITTILVNIMIECILSNYCVLYMRRDESSLTIFVTLDWN